MLTIFVVTVRSVEELAVCKHNLKVREVVAFSIPFSLTLRLVCRHVMCYWCVTLGMGLKSLRTHKAVKVRGKGIVSSY